MITESGLLNPISLRNDFFREIFLSDRMDDELLRESLAIAMKNLGYKINHRICAHQLITPKANHLINKNNCIDEVLNIVRHNQRFNPFVDQLGEHSIFDFKVKGVTFMFNIYSANKNLLPTGGDRLLSPNLIMRICMKDERLVLY